MKQPYSKATATVIWMDKKDLIVTSPNAGNIENLNQKQTDWDIFGKRK